MSIIDMHIHLKGRSSCSILPEYELFDNLSPKLTGICITDHWIIDKIEYPPIYDINVYFGVELNSIEGDILAYGIKYLPSKGLSAQELIKFIHNQHGIAVCAHPFSNRHHAIGDEVYNLKFDAIELNGAIDTKSNVKAHNAAKIMNIPTIGGSDAHAINQLNTYATQFDIPIKNITEILTLIQNNKCKAIRI